MLKKCAGTKVYLNRDLPEKEAFLINTRVLILKTDRGTTICEEHRKILGHNYKKNNANYCRWPHHKNVQIFMAGNKATPKGRKLQEFEKMKNIPGFENGVPRSASFYILKKHGTYFPFQSMCCYDCRTHQINNMLKDFNEDDYPEFTTPVRHRFFLDTLGSTAKQESEPMDSNPPLQPKPCDLYDQIQNTFLSHFKCNGTKVKLHQDLLEEEAFLIQTRVLLLDSPKDTEICAEHIRILGNDYKKNNAQYCRWPNHEAIQKINLQKKKVTKGRFLQDFGMMDIPGFENGVPRAASFYLKDQHGIFFPYESMACSDCRKIEVKELLESFDESEFPEFSTPRRHRSFLDGRGVSVQQHSEPMDYDTPDMETPPSRFKPPTPQTPHGLPTGTYIDNFPYFFFKSSKTLISTIYRSWWFKSERSFKIEGWIYPATSFIWRIRD